MKSLRRLVVYQGITYPNYEIDFYTSQVYSVRYNRFLKYGINSCGYPFVPIRKKKRIHTNAGIHKIMAETFYDIFKLSPLVSYFDLKISNHKQIFNLPTGFTFISRMVCPDHIDGDRSNNHYSNLMIATQFENMLKKGKDTANSKYKYKGTFRRDRKTAWQSQFSSSVILDKNGKRLYKTTCFETEEEGALGFNAMMKDSLLNVFEEELGLKLYDLAYKNKITINN